MRWIKRLFVLILIVAIGAGLWFGFGLWSGLYSIYSFPPSTKNPRGSTLLVERADREPMFNSPDRAIPPPPPREKGVGLGFSSGSIRPKSVEKRTIVELPYIEWAYKKSLEPETLP
jgi:hypothetical protein